MSTIAMVVSPTTGVSKPLNRICGVGVETHDPTVRAFCLRRPTGRRAALVDKVGFISDLPVERMATALWVALGEVLGAEQIVHVIDASSDEWESQRKDTVRTIEAIGVPGSESVI